MPYVLFLPTYTATAWYHRRLDAELQKNEDVVAALSDRPTSRKEPVNFLLIGSDSRENLPDGFEGNFGEFGGERADVIMIVQLLPDDG